MSFQDKLQQIDRLNFSIEDYGKLSRELLQKINYKFRLDWNYYSNRMEGNTLTIDETKSVMIGNINVQNKPLKDIMEMKGHDDAIRNILQIGRGELNISESRIRELHTEIMYENDAGEKEKIGKWKTQSNHVINYRGEKFDFANPSEIADSMHELVNWVNAEKNKIEARKKDALHPVELAFDFHLRYLTIHPFYDGNGRTGRILTNLILISYGFPPIYIKDNEKAFYYRYLAEVQAYGSDKKQLFELMSDYLIRSQNIVLDAIAGKEIEEREDIDKKIQLLERELGAIDATNEVKISFSRTTLIRIYDNWISKLIESAIPVIEKFNKFFEINEHMIQFGPGMGVSPNNRSITELIDFVKVRIQLSLHDAQPPIDFQIHAVYRDFTRIGFNGFDCSAAIRIRFHGKSYEFWVDDVNTNEDSLRPVKIHERLLDQALSASEIEKATTMLGNTIFKQIDIHTQQSRFHH